MPPLPIVEALEVVEEFGARRRPGGRDRVGFKVLIEEGTGRIRGAHLLGPHAAEVINLFAVAIRLRIPADDLQQVIFAYPTNGSDICFML